MGQNLTHGVYLPDEGERNCYNGLAGNWQLLDGAVGTVAEHTTALAGKAPLVHTHTKADITDLLNSNFIPSANNSYDLGSSSYQWNNLYAKNYYYNGTAWGLDKANKWSENNYFTRDLVINSDTAANAQSALSGSKIKQIVFNDSNNSNYFFRLRQYIDATSSRMQFNAQGFDSNNQAYSATFVYKVSSDGTTVLYPGDNNQNLGTSTNKWKTLNGINPGALSLPKTEYTDIDISAQGLNWDLNGGANTYTPARDGWLEIWAVRGSLANAYIDVDNTYIRNNTEVSVLSQAKLTVPVRNSQTYTVRILAKQCLVRLIKAEGNV